MSRLPLRIALCLGAIAVLAGASKPVPPQLKHGRWKERIEIMKMSYDGKIMPFDATENRVSVKYRCLTPSSGGAAGFFGSQMPREKCPTRGGGAGGGKINLTGKCNFGYGSSDVTITGTYGATTQSSTVRMATDLPGGTKMVMESKVEGTFQGPCRGDEEREEAGPR